MTAFLSFQELTDTPSGCCPSTTMHCSRLRRRSINVRLLLVLIGLFVGSMFLLSGPRRELCDQPTLSPPAAGKSIPKRIHRMWRSGHIPDRFKGNWAHCKEVNPTYNVTLWDDAATEALIQKHYPWFMPVYRSYPYTVERLDAGRYFIIYHYGGIYIDMDVDCKVPFDEIFKNISREKPFEVMIGEGLPVGLTNSFFAAAPKHPFMHSMIHHLNTSLGWYLTPYWSVMLSTGTLYITKIYFKYACKDQIHILDADLHKKVYMVHEHAGHWHRWDGPIYVWIDRHLRYVMWGGILFIVAVITLVVVLRTRNRSCRYCSMRWRTTLRKTVGGFSWWRHQIEKFLRYSPFVRGIHSPDKGQWRGALMFSLICAWTNGWVNNRDASDLRRHRTHCDVTVMYCGQHMAIIAMVIVEVTLMNDSSVPNLMIRENQMKRSFEFLVHWILIILTT